MFCLFPLVWKLCLWVFRVGAAFYAIAYHAIRIVVKIWKLLPRATTKHYRPVFFYPQLVNCFLTHKKVVQFNHWTNQHDKQAGIQLSLGAKLIRRQATGAASHRSNYKQATAFNANSEIHWFKASIGEVSHIWPSQIQCLKLLRARSDKLSDWKSKFLIRETFFHFAKHDAFSTKKCNKNLIFWTNQDWECS